MTSLNQFLETTTGAKKANEPKNNFCRNRFKTNHVILQKMREL